MSPVRPEGEVADITRTHWGILITQLDEVAKSIERIAEDDCLTAGEETTLRLAVGSVLRVADELRDEAKR